jgi:hypothetical protein
LNFPGFSGHHNRFDGNSRQELSDAQTRAPEVQ